MRKQRGFSLIELLAAMSVLALILLIFSQVIGMVSETWRRGKARIDNYAQARVALSLIDRDIQSMVLRKDVAAFVRPANSGAGTPQSACAFYTRMAGEESDRDRKISLVFYELADPLDKPKLVRKDFGLDYGGATATRTVKLNETATLPDFKDAPSQEVAAGIIGFQCQFVDGNGVLRDTFQFDYAKPEDATNTRAVAISLAVLDSDSYQLVDNTGKLESLLNALGGSPAAGESFANAWRSKMNEPGFGALLPAPVRGSLRIFERSIHIPVETVGL